MIKTDKPISAVKYNGKNIPIVGGSSIGWERPAEWPDYSKVDLSGQDVCYLTFDTWHPDFPNGTTVGFYGMDNSNSTPLLVEIGELVNGELLVERTAEIPHNGRVDIPLPRNSSHRYEVFKVTAQLEHHIVSLVFSATQYSNAIFRYPCVERYARLPYMVNWSAYNSAFFVVNMKADTIKDKGIYATPAASMKEVYLGQSTRNLEYINLQGANLAGVTTLASFFQGCCSLKELHIEDWDTSSVENFSGFLAYCSSLESVDIKNLNVSKAKTLNNFFGYCSSLKKLDLSGWDVSEVTNFGNLFLHCNALESVDFTGWSNSIANYTASMFSGCRKIESINIDWLNVTDVINAGGMFSICYSLRSVSAKSLNIASGTSVGNFFDQTSNIRDLKLGAWDTSIYITSFAGLTRESTLWIINHLTETATTKTLTLPSYAKALLSTDEIAIATEKGWTIA